MGLMTEERVKSGLNPDAPLFIPAALKQVEDFSPEWWQLITTSAWYRDYWLSQNHDQDLYNEVEEDEFEYNYEDLLPDADDLFQQLFDEP